MQPADKASAEACTAAEALDWLRWGAARDPLGCDAGVSYRSLLFDLIVCVS